MPVSWMAFGNRDTQFRVIALAEQRRHAMAFQLGKAAGADNEFIGQIDAFQLSWCRVMALSYDGRRS